MRFSRGTWVILLLAIVGFVWLLMRVGSRRHIETGTRAIRDLAVTSPLNQPGGDASPAEAYEVYSALYADPMQEPLAFAEDSMTDIPQVLNGSCLKPSSTQEREMAHNFDLANKQSHRWERRFTISAEYRILSATEASQAQSCLQTHSQDPAQCKSYKQLRHVRFLGVPGFDHTHTRALVSVVKICGGHCGSGGIFEVEKASGKWRRSDPTDFTRDCSWMY